MSESLFQWEDRYQLHVKSMDDEHQKLIELMNDLYRKYMEKASTVEQGLALQKLADFAAKHFTDEEAYMQKLNFPGLETHMVIHKSLLTKVNEFAKDFESKKVLTTDLFNFLKTWLAAHIIGIDMKYAHYQASESKAS